MNTKFEHRVEYVDVPFKAMTSGTWIFKTTVLTLEPDAAALLDVREPLQKILYKLGAEGWELVSTQSVCRGEVKVGNQNAQAWSYGFPLPIGYLLFFKRAARCDQSNA